MRKILTAAYVIVMAVLVLSLSGCGGGSNSVSNSSVPSNAQVAVIDSPAFERGKNYRIIKGAALDNMSGAKYFVADVGSEANKAALNLGFSEVIGNQTLVFVNDDTNKVVFAYDPSGTNGNKSTGTVNYSGGTLLKYIGLTLNPSIFTSMNADTESSIIIQLNGDSAVVSGEAVPSYDYVWHADPDHRDEYYTLGLNGTEELDEDDVLDVIGNKSVYINRDIRYMTSSLDFTAMVADDEEQEYAAYYSESVRQVVSDELGGNLTGPYIFATLPRASGMGGGNPPGGNPPSGENPGGNSPVETPVFPAFAANGTSYNSEIESTMKLMTHSAEEAYNNPVLHITKAGVYTLQGTWNGQIWIEVGEESTDKVAIILNSADVTCTVAPALVFKEVYECGPDDSGEVAERYAADKGDIGYSVLDNAGAMVIIADDSVNNFTGSNVYRMLKPAKKKDNVKTIDGTDVSQQKKLYKMDGAFYSFMSMAVGGSTKQNGVLNVKSTSYEGLDTEMHMTFENGVLNVSAPDDGMNFNEDDTSVFTMLSGDLTVISSGGDGIDSNGYIVILNGSLDITAAQDSDQINAGAEGPLDADRGVYVADGVNYSHRAYSGSGGGNPPGPVSPDVPPVSPDVPPVSPDVPPVSPDVPPVSPDVPPVSPDVPPVSPDVPPVSPDVPPVSPDVPPVSPDIPPVSPDIPPDDEPDNPNPNPNPNPSPNPPSDDEPDIQPPVSNDNPPDVPSNPPSGDPSIQPPVSNDNPPDVPSNPPSDPGNTPGYQVDPIDTGWDAEIKTSAGTTKVSISSNATPLTDPDASTPRGINNSDILFRLTRSVNTFSGITAAE